MAAQTKQRRARPAESNRQALARWGFGGKPQMEAAAAYTAEDFAEDEKAGVIECVPRECPANRPERECQCLWCQIKFDLKTARFVAGVRSPVPAYYESRWHQELTYPPPAPTKHNPCPRPRRERTTTKVICFECQQSLWHAERMRFIHEHGPYRLEDGPIDVKRHYPDADQDGPDEHENDSQDVVYVRPL